ncbi:MAG: rRNA maturation RNase YbeY, partial [Spirochaetales bacterium]|nr:rRNA maturation RNase YbeY [Spirochaetales bacterium]
DEIAGFNSFNQPENLGDIIISLDTLKRNSNYFKVNYKEEMERVLIHGILHLIGMHHETNNDDEEMIILQEKILKKITENFFETEYFC